LDKIIEFVTVKPFEVIISVFLTYIAYKQWNIQDEKKRLDLFERRFEFYQSFMLNPLWNDFFYNREEILIENNISEKAKPLNEGIVEKAYFLFPKRIYDKITLAYARLCNLLGRQEVINEIKRIGSDKVQAKDSAENTLLIAEILEKEFMEDEIQKLKKEHSILLNDLHFYIAVERQATIWELLWYTSLSLWDFFIPYKSKIHKHNADLRKEIYDYVKEIKNDKAIIKENATINTNDDEC